MYFVEFIIQEKSVLCSLYIKTCFPGIEDIWISEKVGKKIDWMSVFVDMLTSNKMQEVNSL